MKILSDVERVLLAQLWSEWDCLTCLWTFDHMYFYLSWMFQTVSKTDCYNSFINESTLNFSNQFSVLKSKKIQDVVFLE